MYDVKTSEQLAFQSLLMRSPVLHRWLTPTKGLRLRPHALELTLYGIAERRHNVQLDVRLSLEDDEVSDQKRRRVRTSFCEFPSESRSYPFR